MPGDGEPGVGSPMCRGVASRLAPGAAMAGALCPRLRPRCAPLQAVESVDDGVGSIGDHVSPAGGVVAGKHDAACARQALFGAHRDVGGHPGLSRHHCQSRRDGGEWRGVQPRRHAQQQSRHPIGMQPREVRDVTRHLRRDMRRPQAQMVPQRDHALGQRRRLVHVVAPPARSRMRDGGGRRSGMDDALQEALVALIPRLLGALDRLETITRRMHPPLLPELVATLGDDAGLIAALEQVRRAAWPENLTPFRDQIVLATESVMRCHAGLRSAFGSPQGAFEAYRALRQQYRAIEALYPLASALPSISRFFIEPAMRDDAALLARIEASRRPEPDTGVYHFDNDTGSRGGFSVYVPEYLDAR